MAVQGEMEGTVETHKGQVGRCLVLAGWCKNKAEEDQNQAEG